MTSTDQLSDSLRQWIRENAPELVPVLEFLMNNPEYMGPIKRMAKEES